MPVKHRATFTKRERERARQQHREEKEAKRLQRVAEKKEREPATGEDPDIAGIVPVRSRRRTSTRRSWAAPRRCGGRLIPYKVGLGLALGAVAAWSAAAGSGRPANAGHRRRPPRSDRPPAHRPCRARPHHVRAARRAGQTPRAGRGLRDLGPRRERRATTASSNDGWTAATSSATTRGAISTSTGPVPTTTLPTPRPAAPVSRRCSGGTAGTCGSSAFPYLREGDTVAKLDAMRAYLARSVQRTVPVTIDDQDWSYERPWVAARRAGDAAAMARVAEEYQAALRIEVLAQTAEGDELFGGRSRRSSSCTRTRSGPRSGTPYSPGSRRAGTGSRRRTRCSPTRRSRPRAATTGSRGARSGVTSLTSGRRRRRRSRLRSSFSSRPRRGTGVISRRSARCTTTMRCSSPRRASPGAGRRCSTATRPVTRRRRPWDPVARAARDARGVGERGDAAGRSRTLPGPWREPGRALDAAGGRRFGTHRVDAPRLPSARRPLGDRPGCIDVRPPLRPAATATGGPDAARPPVGLPSAGDDPTLPGVRARAGGG